MIAWLPEPLLFDDYGNDWGRYLEAVYRVFVRDFIETRPTFRGQRLGMKLYPEYEGKTGTFWHMISEGHIEQDRKPDLRRCERIPWPAPIIDNSLAPEIKCWENERNGKKRIVLWAFSEDYVVILERRQGYFIPWTAYVVTHGNTREKLEKEYRAYIKARGAPF